MSVTDARAVDRETRGHDLTENDLTADLATIAALSNRTRYEALRLIATAKGGCCVCEIEPALEVSQGAVSQALSRLAEVDLLTRRKEGRWRYYEATPQAEQLLNTLDDVRGAP